MSLDVSRAREETPGCNEVLHFNNAGASLMPEPVLESVVSYLELEARIGGYEAAGRMQDRLENTYDAAARLVGCDRDEIAVVENATRAWDMAFYSIPFQPEDRILTAEAEYSSNYIAYLQVARKTGASVEVVPSDRSGQLSVDALREMIDERVRLISVTHVPTNGGLVNPAKEIGAVAREAGCLFLLDACQSAGQIPLNVSEVGCDMLSVTGRKFLRGPRGTGFLYVRRGLLDSLEPPFLDLHAATWTSEDTYEVRADARRFENWETNFAGKVGLGVAIDYAFKWGLENIESRVKALAGTLRERVCEIPGITVRDLGREQCGIVTLTSDRKTPLKLFEKLSERGINTSVTPSNSTLIDMERRQLDGLLRASVHYFNTEEEIDRFCRELSRITTG
ncbi:aminotransferase class V-fold PLP-dependent enzyme [Rubrobacter indicoceani]|uniref:aminotransferase class V-fold PLP-dependent enzyme n=1 Tax=Rubrobacter indicoceani TaxID=2051957 RepID=UPI000E5C3B75|nr:aminotransferase class V-fold PLP-dependent enzyme [Rubrobacter indicoceani]